LPFTLPHSHLSFFTRFVRSRSCLSFVARFYLAASLVARYCVVGGHLGVDFALGVIRAAFQCYRRLLQLHWDADKNDGDDDDNTREKVPPSVWLLAVPSEADAAAPFLRSLEADEFALQRLSGRGAQHVCSQTRELLCPKSPLFVV